MNKLLLVFALSFIACTPQKKEKVREVVVGARQMDLYLPLLEDKRVAVTTNHSGMVGKTHLVDTLLSLGIDVTKVFTPEHGFTGSVSDGVSISYDSSTTSYELVSLYGKVKKPTTEMMTDVDIMLFDIQDVGVRFYTYISTLHYIMESCAEANVPLLLLDRPNPNASYVDGPVLDLMNQSFVGMHPIPIVYGMTIGELAQMINGEEWLAGGVKTDLQIIPLKNWTHKTTYSLPVKPSPNLPNDLSVSLYPSLCLFEGTLMSVGRGTDEAFQQVGHPDYPDGQFSFLPESRPGAKHPPYEGLVCYGMSWVGLKPSYSFTLSPLIDAYQKMNRSDFFNTYFTKLAGTNLLQVQIEEGLTEEEIRKSWAQELDEFKVKRESYLIYK